MKKFRRKHMLITILVNLCIQLLLHQFSICVVGDSSPPYSPEDDILLNCGSSGSSTASDRKRTWAGDINSKFFPHDLSQNAASATSQALTQSSSVDNVPYVSARLSNKQFTYTFPVTPGQMFIRLYFYPDSYPRFDRSKAVFTVEVSGYTLLGDFNASVTADAYGLESIYREFLLDVEAGQRVNITFTPSPVGSDSYAFVNGIEIVSMPMNLYYTPTPAGKEAGDNFIGQTSLYPINNNTALETLYRMNVGGAAIAAIDDTGMFRVWSQEDYLTNYRQQYFLPSNGTIDLKFSMIPSYTAPEEVYRNARTMGPDKIINKSYNLTWGFPVDSGFYYLLRLHFCEFESDIDGNGQLQRVFRIYIADQTAETSADVISWTGGKGIPYYRDYVVFISSGVGEKRVNLSIALQANSDDSLTVNNNVILNGVEIFKLNDSNGNLAGQNPDSPPITPAALPPPTPQSTSSKKNVAIIIASTIGGVVFSVVAVVLLSLFILRKRRRSKPSSSSDGAEALWWDPFSFSTTKSTKTRGSSLPSDLCHSFSLAEIKAATNNFLDDFVIGVGGFGHVYKGYIDDGSIPVAIKRLKPGSQQGAHEFTNEIEMLSQLRHVHLVSLIGYCCDGSEMILVYDYMSCGTLRSHLYGSDNPPLTWKQRLEICIGAARGLHYLHTGAKYTIIHRDVKTTNILLDEKLTAKVSDFGLSKVGPTSVSKAHVSTVVKGSVGYLDPEYYRRQQLTEKSDVYSFGVVLCEVLCARPPVTRTKEKDKVSLAEWVRKCNSSNTLDQIVDPNLKNEIAPRCLTKFVEIIISCIQDNGIERPSMNDVVWGLEFALQLQESGADNKDLGGLYDEVKGDYSDNMFSSTSFSGTGEHVTGSISSQTTSSDGQSILKLDSKKDLSISVFSEIMDPKAR